MDSTLALVWGLVSVTDLESASDSASVSELDSELGHHSSLPSKRRYCSRDQCRRCRLLYRMRKSSNDSCRFSNLRTPPHRDWPDSNYPPDISNQRSTAR